MERLSMKEKYSPLETAIHLARYNIALSFCKNKKILDIASGEGYGSYLLANNGAKEVIGVDISQEAVDNAQNCFKKENLKYIVQDACCLEKIEDNYFDMVISLETFEHVKDVDSFLKEIKRVSKKDAIIIISCPNDYFYYSDGNGNPYHYKKYHFEEFRSVVEKYFGSNNVNYYAGVQCNGFVNFNINDFNKIDKQVSMVDIDTNKVDTVLVNSSSKYEFDDCNYYIGIWNGKLKNANSVIFPCNDINKELAISSNNFDSKLLKQKEDFMFIISDLKAELDKYKQLFIINKNELEVLRQYNRELYESKENYERIYSRITKSWYYKILRKLKKILRKVKKLIKRK